MITITLELEDSFINKSIVEDIDKSHDAKDLLIHLMNKLAFIDLKHTLDKKEAILFLNSNDVPDEHIDRFRTLVAQVYMFCKVSEDNITL